MHPTMFKNAVLIQSVYKNFSVNTFCYCDVIISQSLTELIQEIIFNGLLASNILPSLYTRCS